MAKVFFSLGSAAILATVLFVSAGAQSNGCSNALINLSSCLNYITGNSTTPSSSCCQQLGNVVQSEPQCLCMVINGGGAGMGINVNQTQALALPGACNLKTPPMSQCNAADGPGSPSNSPGTSDGSTIIRAPISLLFSLLLAMAYLSTSPTSF